MRTWKLGLILSVTLFLTLFSPYWLIQFISLFTFFTLGTSFLYARLVYLGLKVSSSQALIRAHKFEPVDLFYLVENRSLFKISHLTIHASSGQLFFTKDNKLIMFNFGEKKAHLHFQLESHHRGEYIIGNMTIKGSDPLGLFAWDKHFSFNIKVLIYPSVYNVHGTIKKGITGGPIKTFDKAHEDVTRYDYIREYLPGDDTKKINWKASARLGSLHVMQYASSLQSPVMLLLNLNVNDFPLKYRSNLIEKAIATTASLSMFFTRLHQEIGLVTSGIIDDRHQVFPMRGGYAHSILILESLAKVKESEQDENVITLLRNANSVPSSGARIILITPVLKEEHLKALNILRRRGIIIDVYYIEQSFTAEQFSHFQGINFYHTNKREKDLTYET